MILSKIQPASVKVRILRMNLPKIAPASAKPGILRMNVVTRTYRNIAAIVYSPNGGDILFLRCVSIGRICIKGCMSLI